MLSFQVGFGVLNVQKHLKYAQNSAIPHSDPSVLADWDKQKTFPYPSVHFVMRARYRRFFSLDI